MKSLLTEMAVREVSTQCTFALKAYENINHKAGSTDLVFSSVHSFLSHCHNIWLLLVNQKLSQDVQPRTIRDILGVNPSSPLKNTHLRNMLEHYDEELYKWISGLTSSSRGFIADFNIGIKSAFGLPQGTIFVRHYDPTTEEFSILGDTLELHPMADAIRQIRASANSWIESESIRP